MVYKWRSKCAVVLLCLLRNTIIVLPSPSPTSSSFLGLEDPQDGGRALLRKLAGFTTRQTYVTSRRTLILILILLSHLCSGPPSGIFHSGFPISKLYEIFSCPMHATRHSKGLYIYIYIYICVCVCVCVCVSVCECSYKSNELLWFCWDI
jgi:hypothetical protein